MPPPPRYNRLNAFTLAEVLITLAIIGVVAALTVPGVIKNYKKHQTEIKLKKSYSTLNNAVIMQEAESGIRRQDWNFEIDGVEFYNTYLRKHLKTINSTSYADYQKNAQVVWRNGQRASGNAWTLENPQRANYNAILPDGTIIVIQGTFATNAVQKRFAIDVNGDKKPNMVGVDIFIFSLSKTDKLSFPVLIDDDCRKNSYGVACASMIMINNWKIPTKEQYRNLGGEVNQYPW